MKITSIKTNRQSADAVCKMSWTT